MSPFDQFKNDYQGKKILIFGLGLQGRGVGDALTFAKIGCQVTVTDLKTKTELAPSLEKLQAYPIEYVLGEHRQQDILAADVIVRNAAVPWQHPLLNLARQKRKPIVMDTALFARYCRVPLIGVTGTRGKSTTTVLIYELLKASGKGEILLGGNAIKQATLPLLKKIKVPHTTAVLELSSWQLQGFDQEKISPYLAVITNLYEDHLNYYSDLTSYAADKALIFKYQEKTDYLVLNQANPFSHKFAALAKAQIIWFSVNDLPSAWHLKLNGSHNRENAAAAYQVGKILKLYPDWMQAVFETFHGLPYRLETIAQVSGVRVINDTTSTTPIATIKAIESIPGPIILIAGGASKNLDYRPLGLLIRDKVRHVVLLAGNATVDLERAIAAKKLIAGHYSQLVPAISKAFALAKSGDTILFSPACASFGMFQNEFDRGDQFNQIVSQCQAKP